MDRKQKRAAGVFPAAAFFAGVCLVAAAALADSPPMDQGRPETAMEAALLAEFRGAFTGDVIPSGVVRAYEIVAEPSVVPLFDGRPLEVWAYNGQVPGPTLRVRLGETLRVRFTNRLPQPTTIHWHGVRVPNGMDGVPNVTQPPVPPGGTFVYEFTPKDAGTFWFHPHLRASEQVERGLFGVLIVEDTKPLPYSREVVWVLDDWLLGKDGAISPEFNTRHDLAHDGRWGNVITVNGDEQATSTARPGERIRLRLVNVANGRVFAPDFSGLDAKAIAVDGMYSARPFDPTGFELAPGNRLDLDVTFPEASGGRQLIVNDRFTRTVHRLASFDVRGETVPAPSFPAPAAAHIPDWTGTEAVLPRLEFKLNARRGGPFGIQWTLNGIAMEHDHGGAGEHGAPYSLPLARWSKVRFTNESSRLHPMHLHGMFFKLLSRNGRPVSEPHWRDTVLVRARESVDVGLVPADVGRWMAHCHILEHAESGMMTLIDVR